MTRRTFLTQTGSLAAGLAAAATPARPQGRPTKKVIVCGAGISGLSCGYELLKRGHEVVVLEALGRSGGHVLTVRDHLADGLYADAGDEHFYRRGYDEFFGYLDEFDLPLIRYPRRDAMLRFIDGRPYTEEMLADPAVLKKFSLNQREIDYLARHDFSEFSVLYLNPYLDSFADENRPLGAGLDRLDQMTVTELFQKDGASAGALPLIGGSRSALYTVWQSAIKKRRGMQQYVKEVVRIRGGNQRVTDTLAAKLGERLRLGCPVTGLAHGATGVTVEYQEFGQPKKMAADYVVLSMPFRPLREVRVMPDWPAAKRYIVENLHYDLKARVIFQSRTKFWKRDGVSPNIIFGEQELADTWAMAEDVPTSRGLLIGQARTSLAENSFARFRALYPGKSQDIEQAMLVNWTLDPYAGTCLPLGWTPGETAKFWPELIRPYGRIHFASVATHCFPNGLEAGVRAAKVTAEAIDRG
jgi:monoamine oxidase